MIGYVLLIVATAFAFEFRNGFHGSANASATVVSTRVLSPLVAVAWSALFNFSALFLVGRAAAETVGSGMIRTGPVTRSAIWRGRDGRPALPPTAARDRKGLRQEP